MEAVIHGLFELELSPEVAPWAHGRCSINVWGVTEWASGIPGSRKGVVLWLGPTTEARARGQMEWWHKVIADQSSGQELGGRLSGAQTRPPSKEHLMSQTCQRGRDARELFPQAQPQVERTFTATSKWSELLLQTSKKSVSRNIEQ